MTPREAASTITEQTRFAWPIVVAIVGTGAWLAVQVGGINERLARIEERFSAFGLRLERIEAVERQR